MNDLSELTILYEHGGCLAVLKPAGIATQAPPGIDSVETRLKAQLAARTAGQEPVYLGVPHRLDRPVSGVMLFATSRKAARKLARQFEYREVGKTYWAVVAGDVEPAMGDWQDFMRKIPGEAKAETVAADHPEAQLALLRYRERGRVAGGTWLEIVLETGRTHQIRVQAAARGLPVWGDALYGSATAFGPPTDDVRTQKIALHAREITFCDPVLKTEVSVTAPLPPEWQALGL